MLQRTEAPKFEISEVDGHPFGDADLRVLLVTFKEKEKFLNLETEYKPTDGITKGLNTAFEKWKMGAADKKRHHGWEGSSYNGEYVNCYVFKHLAKKVRVYGYLVHPMPESRIICCVLMHYEKKVEDETDENILKNLVRIGTDPELIKGVEEFYKNHLLNKEKGNESQER